MISRKNTSLLIFFACLISLNLIHASNSLKLANRPIDHSLYDTPIEDGFQPVAFRTSKDNTQRIDITGVFMKPCYLTKTNLADSKIQSCGVITGQDATVDVRFRVKGEKSIGNPHLKARATLGSCNGRGCTFGSIMAGQGLNYDMGKYKEPCLPGVSEETRLKCPIRAKNEESELRVKLSLPEKFVGITVPETNVTTLMKLQGPRYRRATVAVEVDLETLWADADL